MELTSGEVRTPVPAAVLLLLLGSLHPSQTRKCPDSLRGALGARVKGERGEIILPKEPAQTLLAHHEAFGLRWLWFPFPNTFARSVLGLSNTPALLAQLWH